jgi:hypothetical protein
MPDADYEDEVEYDHEHLVARLNADHQGGHTVHTLYKQTDVIIFVHGIFVQYM